MVLRRPNQQVVEVKTQSTKAKTILALGAIVTALMFSAGAAAQSNGYGTMPMPLYGQPRQINADPYKPSGEPNYRYQGGPGRNTSTTCLIRAIRSATPRTLAPRSATQRT